MNITKFKTALSDLIRNGLIGLFSGGVLFYPGGLLGYYLFHYIFFVVLYKRHYSNTDDILLLYFFYPIALALSLGLGMLGGLWGSKIKRTQRGAIIGSVIGGGIGGLLIGGWMAYVIVSWWATYYD
jgi:hypothetical protein